MDAATALDSLSTLLTSLSEAPYSLALHVQHIHLASLPLPEFAGQLDSAIQLLLSFYSATDQVWLPFLDEKIKNLGVLGELGSVDDVALLNLQETSVEAVLDVLELFRKAENDYLSIPILQKKIELLTLLQSSYEASPNPNFETLLAQTVVRVAIAEAVSKGSMHLTKGHVLWELQVAWELGCLKSAESDSSAQGSLKDHIKSLHVNRLSQIHSTHEQTLQSYSSFISEYCSASEYESHLVEASKIRSGPAKAWDKKERYELTLNDSPESYHSYIWSEKRVKSQNGALLHALYERVIAEYAGKRWEAYSNNSEQSAIDLLENSLRAYWCDYIDTLRASCDGMTELPIIHRAIRSVPGSGEVWARYIRALERAEDAGHSMGSSDESVADAFSKALSTSLVQQDLDQILPLVLAKAGYEKRHLKDEQGLQTLVAGLREGISIVRNSSKEGDPRMTLEKYLAGVYLDSELDYTTEALALWQDTAKYHKSSYLAWSKYSELLIAGQDYTRARALFKDICTRKLDWPEAIWQAWIDFEHLHGSVKDIESCIEKIKGLAPRLEQKRAEETAAAQKAWLEASTATVIPPDAQASAGDSVTDPMVVERPEGPQSVPKRKADESSGPEISKRARIDEVPKLKRDRENSTVFVSGLVAGTSEEDLVALFKDCGKIREIKLTELSESLVATVEFHERTSVPAALTKDKKRVNGEEIAVHLAWESTLYVTNFPDKTNDTSIRNLFGPYGTIFEVRWPSKKYKSTRRFCYIQYTSPSAAKAALVLHGHKLEPGRNLTVYISDPERKQERTDVTASARELYVAGLSKSVNQSDLRKLFEKYGSISDIRMILDEKGNSKGFAFVEFHHETSADAALAANNQELKKRRIAVTLADTRVQPRQRDGTSASSSARRSRTLRIRNLPPGTQEGLLQQTLEKFADVKRVEVFVDKNEAMVELTSVAEAGKLLLMSKITYGDRALELFEEDLPASSRESVKSQPMFVPRGAAGRPRAGIGSNKQGSKMRGTNTLSAGPSTTPDDSGKGQDDFRRMLNPSM